MSEKNNTNQPSQIESAKAALRPVFGQITDEQWSALECSLEWVYVKGGDKIIRQGEPSDCIYFLLHGRLSAVFEDEDGSSRKLGDIVQGQSVGEIGIFTKEPRTASVIAIRDAVLLKMSDEALHKAAALFPDMMFNVMNTVIKRATSQYTPKTLSPVRNIVFVARTNSQRFATFVEGVQKEIARHAQVHVVSQQEILSMCNITKADLESTDPLINGKIQQAIDDLEINNEYVLFTANEDEPAWVNKAIRQADIYYFIKDFDDDFELSPIEKIIFDEKFYFRLKEKHLVLLHEDGSKRPQNTRFFLEKRDVDLHHHVRMDRSSDIHRIARFIRGCTIGIACAGGGAKGMAHVGIIKTFLENGVPIDYFCGTSAGALAAAAAAMDMGNEEFVNCLYELAVESPTRRKNMNIIPIISIMKGEDLDRCMHKYFGHVNIEDLWINFSCMASNMTKRKPVIIDRGPLDQAVRASIALPGVFPPVVRGNDLWVDGALINNLPINILQNNNIAIKIAVTLHKNKDNKLNYNKVPDSWQYIINTVKGKKIKTPKITSLMMESMLLASYSQYKDALKLADLHLHPPVDKVGLLQWHRYLELVRIGSEYADEVLSTPEAKELFKEFR